MSETTQAAQPTEVRHMITLSEAHKAKLKKVAKHFMLTQGEIVEVMLNQLDMSRMGQHFEAARNAKVSERTSVGSLASRIKAKELTPEQRAAIEAILAGTTIAAI